MRWIASTLPNSNLWDSFPLALPCLENHFRPLFIHAGHVSAVLLLLWGWSPPRADPLIMLPCWNKITCGGIEPLDHQAMSITKSEFLIIYSDTLPNSDLWDSCPLALPCLENPFSPLLYPRWPRVGSAATYSGKWSPTQGRSTRYATMLKMNGMQRNRTSGSPGHVDHKVGILTIYSDTYNAHSLLTRRVPVFRLP